MKKLSITIKSKVKQWKTNNLYSPFPVVDTEIISDAIKLINIMNKTEENYNDIPVEYCDSCLSLKIKELENTNIPYCGICGDASIKKTSIEQWEEEYKELYGISFIERNK